MKIGDTLYLDIKNNDHEIEKYRCKVIDKNDQYLFIDYPIHDQTKKTIFLPNDLPFHVMYQINDCVYRFRSHVVKRISASIPTLAIYFPHKQDHQRIQRRKYVRVETDIDVAIHCPNDTFMPFTTVTADISGGGLSIFIDQKDFKEKQPVKIRLVLKMNSGDFYYVFAEAAFVRYKQNINDVKTASFMFTDISKEDQQQMIRYCFEKQREERQKEFIINDK